LAAYGESGVTGECEITEVAEVAENYELVENIFLFAGLCGIRKDTAKWDK
jgi:hypothetical protein